jgi:glycosyltransferase involved in cell wall biosynthesis
MRSSVIRQKVVEVIPNPIREAFVRSNTSQREARELAGYDIEAMIIFIVAENLADPNKNVQPFLDALPSHLADGTRLKLMLVGSNGNSIKSRSLDVVRLGKLTSTELADLLPMADFLAVPSHAENSPSTIWEAAALGVPSLVQISNPGGEELVTSAGFAIAVDGFTEIEEKLLELRSLRRIKHSEISSNARALASGAQVVNRYLKIYSR